MNSLDLATIAHEVLCLMLFYSCFCRAVKSDTRVHMDVRLAFNMLGGVACWGMAAPLMGHEPGSFSLSLLGAIVYTQWVTASHWSDGVPVRFMKLEHQPKRRMTDREARHG